MAESMPVPGASAEPESRSQETPVNAGVSSSAPLSETLLPTNAPPVAEIPSFDDELPVIEMVDPGTNSLVSEPVPADASQNSAPAENDSLMENGGRSFIERVRKRNPRLANMIASATTLADKLKAKVKTFSKPTFVDQVPNLQPPTDADRPANENSTPLLEAPVTNPDSPNANSSEVTPEEKVFVYTEADFNTSENTQQSEPAVESVSPQKILSETEAYSKLKEQQLSESQIDRVMEGLIGRDSEGKRNSVDMLADLQRAVANRLEAAVAKVEAVEQGIKSSEENSRAMKIYVETRTQLAAQERDDQIAAIRASERQSSGLSDSEARLQVAQGNAESARKRLEEIRKQPSKLQEGKKPEINLLSEEVTNNELAAENARVEIAAREQQVNKAVEDQTPAVEQRYQARIAEAKVEAEEIKRELDSQGDYTPEDVAKWASAELELTVFEAKRDQENLAKWENVIVNPEQTAKEIANVEIAQDLSVTNKEEIVEAAREKLNKLKIEIGGGSGLPFAVAMQESQGTLKAAESDLATAEAELNRAKTSREQEIRAARERLLPKEIVNPEGNNYEGNETVPVKTFSGQETTTTVNELLTSQIDPNITQGERQVSAAQDKINKIKLEIGTSGLPLALASQESQATLRAAENELVTAQAELKRVTAERNERLKSGEFKKKPLTSVGEMSEFAVWGGQVLEPDANGTVTKEVQVAGLYEREADKFAQLVESTKNRIRDQKTTGVEGTEGVTSVVRETPLSSNAPLEGTRAIDASETAIPLTTSVGLTPTSSQNASENSGEGASYTVDELRTLQRSGIPLSQADVNRLSEANAIISQQNAGIRVRQPGEAGPLDPATADALMESARQTVRGKLTQPGPIDPNNITQYVGLGGTGEGLPSEVRIQVEAEISRRAAEKLARDLNRPATPVTPEQEALARKALGDRIIREEVVADAQEGRPLSAGQIALGVDAGMTGNEPGLPAGVAQRLRDEAATRVRTPARRLTPEDEARARNALQASQSTGGAPQSLPEEDELRRRVAQQNARNTTAEGAINDSLSSAVKLTPEMADDARSKNRQNRSLERARDIGEGAKNKFIELGKQMWKNKWDIAAKVVIGGVGGIVGAGLVTGVAATFGPVAAIGVPAIALSTEAIFAGHRGINKLRVRFNSELTQEEKRDKLAAIEKQNPKALQYLRVFVTGVGVGGLKQFITMWSQGIPSGGQPSSSGNVDMPETKIPTRPSGTGAIGTPGGAQPSGGGSPILDLPETKLPGGVAPTSPEISGSIDFNMGLEVKHGDGVFQAVNRYFLQHGVEPWRAGILADEAAKAAVKQNFHLTVEHGLKLTEAFPTNELRGAALQVAQTNSPAGYWNGPARVAFRQALDLFKN